MTHTPPIADTSAEGRQSAKQSGQAGMLSTNGLTIVRTPLRSIAGELRHRRRVRLVDVGLAVGVPTALLGIWQLASGLGWIDPLIYPPPSKVVDAAMAMSNDGDLLRYIRTSFRLVVVGFVIGATVGFLLGLATGLSPRMRAALEPTFNALYVVPKLAILPVFLTIFGFGTMPILALIAATVFFFVWIDVMEAVSRIDQGYRDAAKSFGATRAQMFRHVLLPAILPQLFVSLRISVGVAVLISVAAEFVVGGDGLGSLIYRSNQLFMIDRVYVGIAAVSILGVVLQYAVRSIGQVMTPWERQNRDSRLALR